LSIDVYNLILDGLGTQAVGSDQDNVAVDRDPGADCGMRGLVTSLFPPAPGIVTDSHSWDEADMDTLVQKLFFRVEVLAPRRVHVFAHSFGNNVLVALGDYLEQWYDGEDPWIDCAVGFDPCRNPLTGVKDWRMSRQIRRAVSFYQQGGRPFGVSGTPFDPREGLTQYEVTDRRRVKVNDNGIVHVEDWGDGPALAHVDIAGLRGIIMEPAVRSRVNAFLFSGFPSVTE
jgi:hypothetical protein